MPSENVVKDRKKKTLAGEVERELARILQSKQNSIREILDMGMKYNTTKAHRKATAYSMNQPASLEDLYELVSSNPGYRDRLTRSKRIKKGEEEGADTSPAGVKKYQKDYGSFYLNQLY